MVPMAQRGGGSQLLADAVLHLFDEVWVYDYTRLGRDDVDPLQVRQALDRVGIAVFSLKEGYASAFMYHIHVAVAAEERRKFMERSRDGMDRAATLGRYTGGIVPLGYRVEGKKQHARLVPDDSSVWADWTAMDLVQRMYHWVGADGLSCRWLADHLNALGVPPPYRRVGPGIRIKRTQGVWRPGRIRNLLVNPTYKGVLQYGRRRSKNSKRTEIIEAAVPALVTPELWEATQQVLHSKRIMPLRSTHVFLLRSVMVCGICGLHYIGAQGRPGLHWYRCNGGLVERGPIAGKCPSKAIRSDWLEPVVWNDIETWLRNPGDLLDQLDANQERDHQRAALEAERITLEHAREQIAERRKIALDLRLHKRFTNEELDEKLDELDAERKKVEDRLKLLAVPDEPQESTVTPDLLAELRRRLDEGELSPETRHEIVMALVSRIVVYTEMKEDGKKQLRLRIEYRFPDPGCSPHDTGTDS